MSSLPYQLTMEEQETTIRIDRLDDIAYIYTNDSTMITKLRKLLGAEGTQWELINDDGVGLKVICPKNLISLRTRTMKQTDKQKEASRKLMNKLYEQGKL